MDQFTYRPPPTNRYRTVKPATWPQDNLIVPEGFGLMPRVERLNADAVKREWFTYNARLGPFAAGATLSTIVATDQDGDFWLDNIVVNSLSSVFAEETIVDGKFQVRDINQGYNLFPASNLTDGAPLALFQVTAPSVTLAAGPRTVGAGLRTSLIQPYCFMRAGGIEITVSLESWAVAGNHTVFFNLSGWKEYDNAAA